jgi:molecular chaperone GrpE
MTEMNPETSGATESSASPVSTESLQQELEQAKARADQYHQSWQRSAADFANFKRRVDDEKRYAERWILQDLLPVLDDFERAWSCAPKELLKFTWLEGLLQVHSKLHAVLQRHGVSSIEAEGKEFNPIEHEAVMRDEGAAADQASFVVAELQRGYRLHERVLRPALVKVGEPPPAEAAPDAESSP